MNCMIEQQIETVKLCRKIQIRGKYNHSFIAGGFFISLPYVKGTNPSFNSVSQLTTV